MARPNRESPNPPHVVPPTSPQSAAPGVGRVAQIKSAGASGGSYVWNPAGRLTAHGALDRFLYASMVPGMTRSVFGGGGGSGGGAPAASGRGGGGWQSWLLGRPSETMVGRTEYNCAAASTGRKGVVSPDPELSGQKPSRVDNKPKLSWFSRRTQPVRSWDVERPGWEWGVEPTAHELYPDGADKELLDA